MTAETYRGKPCAYGHNGVRYRSNRKCVQCYTLPVRYLVVLDGDVYGGLFDSPAGARRQAPQEATVWRATPLDIK